MSKETSDLTIEQQLEISQREHNILKKLFIDEIDYLQDKYDEKLRQEMNRWVDPFRYAIYNLQRERCEEVKEYEEKIRDLIEQRNQRNGEITDLHKKLSDKNREIEHLKDEIKRVCNREKEAIENIRKEMNRLKEEKGILVVKPSSSSSSSRPPINQELLDHYNGLIAGLNEQLAHQGRFQSNSLIDELNDTINKREILLGNRPATNTLYNKFYNS